MNTLRIAAALTLTLLFNSGPTQAQIYTQAPIHQPIYSAPTIHSALPVPQDPFSACQCNPNTPGDCECKNLSCKIKLPLNCKFKKRTTKTPVLCKIYGKIPVIDSISDCLSKQCGFQYPTEVPVIHCIKESCCEIGTKLIQCLPGCCFSVCVPVNACVTQSVQCKLDQKPMQMELWSRNQDGRIVYDVYVINDENPASAFHAGGMPAKWVILHCGTEDEVKRRFPGATCIEGQPILPSVSLKKGVKPEATGADVDIKLVVDEAKVQQYLKKLNESGAEEQGELEVSQTDQAEKTVKVAGT